MGPIGFKELVVILIVVLLIFGAKKLKTIGSDLGSAVRGFKKSMSEGDQEESVKQRKADAEFSESAKTHAEKSEHKAGCSGADAPGRSRGVETGSILTAAGKASQYAGRAFHVCHPCLKSDSPNSC